MMKLTSEQEAEFDILARASATHKFAVPFGVLPGERLQEAFDRLQTREWIRLIDLWPPPVAHPEAGLFRVFLVTQPARDWMVQARSALQ